MGHISLNTPAAVAGSPADLTKLEFDLKDYPVIFFRGMKELKDALEKRLRGLAEKRTRGPGRPRA